jgi:hypothetical protein
MKAAASLALARLALRYPGLVPPIIIALACWHGMMWLARVNPRGAVLVYCFVCGGLGLRPWKCW